MKNIQTFFEQNQLYFKTQKQGISWIKRNLKPAIPNYLVNEDEIEKLFQRYLQKRAHIYKEQVQRGNFFFLKPK